MNNTKSINYKKRFYQLLVFTILIFVLCVVLWVHGNYTKKVLNKLGVLSGGVGDSTFLGIDSANITKGEGKKLNVLILGNSITIHQICDYWWEERGMASSELCKDYVHVLVNMLSKNYEVNLTAVNYYQWEYMWYDRSETISLIDPLLENEWNYVVIQLGENMLNIDTATKDFEELLDSIHESTGARCIVIGNFWTNQELEKIKALLPRNREFVSYLPLTELQNKVYQNKIGTEVLGADGIIHVIEHSGVACHPNDLAMICIAEKIYEEIIKDKN